MCYTFLRYLLLSQGYIIDNDSRITSIILDPNILSTVLPRYPIVDELILSRLQIIDICLIKPGRTSIFIPHF